MTCHDDDSREITLVIRIPRDFPSSPPLVSGNFPGDFNFFWHAQVRAIRTRVFTALQESNLVALLDEFHSFLSTLKWFWDELDAVDARFRVVSDCPAEIPYDVTSRTIKISALQCHGC